MVKWNYGESYKKFPISKGEVYVEENTKSKVSIKDIFEEPPTYLKEADMVYIDPPWNTGNINSFYTKAGIHIKRKYDDFLIRVLHYLKFIQPKVIYTEIGKQNVDKVKNALKETFPGKVIQSWRITYYKKRPMYLVRVGDTEQIFDFTGYDDEETPNLAMKNENFNCVADFCLGRGLILETAYKLKKKCVGSELNDRRISVAIEKVNKLGGKWKK